MLSKTYKINYNQTSGNEDEFNLYFYFIKSININYIEIYTLNINEKQYKYELNKKEKSIFYKLFKISIDFLHKDIRSIIILNDINEIYIPEPTNSSSIEHIDSYEITVNKISLNEILLRIFKCTHNYQIKCNYPNKKYNHPNSKKNINYDNLITPNINTIFFIISLINFIIKFIIDDNLLFEYNKLRLLIDYSKITTLPYTCSSIISQYFNYFYEIFENKYNINDHSLFKFIFNNFQLQYNNIFNYLYTYRSYYLLNYYNKYLKLQNVSIDPDEYLDEQQNLDIYDFSILNEIVSNKQWRFSNISKLHFDIETYESDYIKKIIKNIYIKFIESHNHIKLYQISFEDGGNNLSNIKNLVWFLELLPEIKYTQPLYLQNSVEEFKNSEELLQDLIELKITYDKDNNNIIKLENKNNWYIKLHCQTNDNLELSFLYNKELHSLKFQIFSIDENTVTLEGDTSIFTTDGIFTTDVAIINLTSKFFTHKILGRTLFITNFQDNEINKIYCYKVKKLNEDIKELEYEKNMIKKFGNQLSNIIDYIDSTIKLVNDPSNQLKKWSNFDWFQKKFNENKGNENFDINSDSYLFYQIKDSEKINQNKNYIFNAIKYTYYLEEELDDYNFFQGSQICLEQIGKLLKTPYYHSSLINLFHNVNDERKYSFLADIMVSQTGRYGYGKLSRFYKIGKFSNMRLIGFADFAEIKPKNIIQKKFNKYGVKTVEIIEKNEIFQDISNSNQYFKYSPNQNAIIELELLLNNYFSWVLILINRRLQQHYENDISLNVLDKLWIQSLAKSNPNYICDSNCSCLGNILKWGMIQIINSYSNKSNDIIKLINDTSIIDFELSAKQIHYFTSLQYIKDTVNLQVSKELYPNAIINMPKVINILDTIANLNQKNINNWINDKDTIEEKFAILFNTNNDSELITYENFNSLSINEKIKFLKNYIPRGWVKIILSNIDDNNKYMEIDLGWMSSLLFIYNENPDYLINLINNNNIFEFIDFIGNSEKGGIIIFIKLNDRSKLSDIDNLLWKLFYTFIDGGASNGSFPFMELLKGSYLVFFNSIYSNSNSLDIIKNISFDNSLIRIHLLHTLINSYYNDDHSFIDRIYQNFNYDLISTDYIFNEISTLYTLTTNEDKIYNYFNKCSQDLHIKYIKVDILKIYIDTLLYDIDITKKQKNINFNNRMIIICDLLLETHLLFFISNFTQNFISKIKSIKQIKNILSDLNYINEKSDSSIQYIFENINISFDNEFNKLDFMSNLIITISQYIKKNIDDKFNLQLKINQSRGKFIKQFKSFDDVVDSHKNILLVFLLLTTIESGEYYNMNIYNIPKIMNFYNIIYSKYTKKFVF